MSFPISRAWLFASPKDLPDASGVQASLRPARTHGTGCIFSQYVENGLGTARGFSFAHRKVEPMRFRDFAFAATVVLGLTLGLSLSTQDPDYVLSLSDGSGPQGGSVSLVIGLDNTGGDIQGWSISVCDQVWSTAVKPM